MESYPLNCTVAATKFRDSGLFMYNMFALAPLSKVTLYDKNDELLTFVKIFDLKNSLLMIMSYGRTL